jgi:hypothetical protein
MHGGGGGVNSNAARSNFNGLRKACDWEKSKKERLSNYA